MRGYESITMHSEQNQPLNLKNIVCVPIGYLLDLKTLKCICSSWRYHLLIVELIECILVLICYVQDHTNFVVLLFKDEMKRQKRCSFWWTIHSTAVKQEWLPKFLLSHRNCYYFYTALYHTVALENRRFTEICGICALQYSWIYTFL